MQISLISPEMVENAPDNTEAQKQAEREKAQKESKASSDNLFGSVMDKIGEMVKKSENPSKFLTEDLYKTMPDLFGAILSLMGGSAGNFGDWISNLFKFEGGGKAPKYNPDAVPLGTGLGNLCCAKYVSKVFGVEPPIMMAEAFRDWGKSKGGVETKDKSRLKPGDIVLFHNTYGNWGSGVITHVGFVQRIEGGKVIVRHHPTFQTGVSDIPLDNWGDKFLSAVHFS